MKIVHYLDNFCYTFPGILHLTDLINNCNPLLYPFIFRKHFQILFAAGTQQLVRGRASVYINFIYSDHLHVNSNILLPKSSFLMQHFVCGCLIKFILTLESENKKIQSPYST